MFAKKTHMTVTRLGGGRGGCRFIFLIEQTCVWVDQVVSLGPRVFNMIMSRIKYTCARSTLAWSRRWPNGTLEAIKK